MVVINPGRDTYITVELLKPGLIHSLLVLEGRVDREEPFFETVAELVLVDHSRQEGIQNLELV